MAKGGEEGVPRAVRRGARTIGTPLKRESRHGPFEPLPDAAGWQSAVTCNGWPPADSAVGAARAVAAAGAVVAARAVAAAVVEVDTAAGAAAAGAAEAEAGAACSVGDGEGVAAAWRP